jgi:hypothetical protein
MRAMRDSSRTLAAARGRDLRISLWLSHTWTLRVSQPEWLTIASIASPKAPWYKTSINPGMLEGLKSMPTTAYSGLCLVHILYSAS